MPRRPRVLLADFPLHIVQRGINREACFFAEEDCHCYLHWLEETSRACGCAIHAYVLMTNHVHVLLTPAASGATARLMQSLGRRYVQYVNRFYRRTGSLWEGRYKSSMVQTEDYLLACQRYIELNPVRAGMVDDPGQYRWSSYRSNGLRQLDSRLKPHPHYLSLGDSPDTRCTAYRELFRPQLDADAAETIREALRPGMPLGTSDLPKASVGNWEFGGIQGNVVGLSVKNPMGQACCLGKRILDFERRKQLKTLFFIWKIGNVSDPFGLSANLDLASNPFYSDFTDHVPLTDAAKALPAMQGSGLVRDLQEAASLNAALVGEVNGFAGMTRSQMQSGIDTLLADWSATSTLKTSLADAQSRGFTLAYLPPGMNQDDYLALHGGGAIPAGRTPERLAALQAQEQYYDKLIGILERFNGMQWATVSNNGVSLAPGQVLTATAPYFTNASGIWGQASDKYAFVYLNAAQTWMLDQSYAQLKSSVYDGMAMETRLKPYMEDISLSIDDKRIRLDFSAIEAANDFEWRRKA